jgi:hypothetical protein
MVGKVIRMAARVIFTASIALENPQASELQWLQDH